MEHKAGVLSITATKDKADVDVKSDTIRLLVKPGDRQFPVAEEPEVKTVHVETNLPQIYAVWHRNTKPALWVQVKVNVR